MNTSANQPDETVVKPTIIDLDADQVIDKDLPPKTVPTTAPSKRNKLLVPALALGVGLVGGGWLYRDLLQSYLPSDQLKAMATRLETVELANSKLTEQLATIDRLSTQLKTDVDAIEDATTAAQGETKTLSDGLSATAANIAAVQAQMDEAKTSIAEIASRPVASGGTATSLPIDIATRLANIEKDVASLKARENTAAQDKAALAQALSDLKAKVEAGLSFASENERIARMVPAAAGLDILKAHAATGLPNAQGLSQELSTIAAALPKPEIAPSLPLEKSWWDTIADAVSDLVVIRDSTSQDWLVIAEKAMAFAEAGDLAQAISSLDEAEGAKPAPVQNWRDKAQSRLDLEAAVTNVGDAVTRTLAQGQ